MRVFLDENIPRQIRFALSGHDVSYVEEEGWKGVDNGALLDLVAARLNVLVSADGNIFHQQELQRRSLSIIVVPTNNLTILRANAVAIQMTLEEIAGLDHPAYIEIDWRGRRTMRRLDDETSVEWELLPVPPFRRG
jgi:PIN like domain